MSGGRKGKLRFRLFTLLTLLLGLVALGDDDLTRKADADQYQDINTCVSAFGTGADNCGWDYYLCRNSCYTECDKCLPIFSSCFTDKVIKYSQCLGEVHFTLDMCYAARDAAGTCNASYYHCLDVAQTDEQLGDCMNTFFECRNASGIDQCQ